MQVIIIIRNSVKYNSEWNKWTTFGGKLESPAPGFWSSVSFKISVVTRFLLLLCDTLYTCGPNFPYTKYGG